MVELKTNESGTYFNISKKDLNLHKTLDCGQCFRWTHAGKSGIGNQDIFCGVVGDKFIAIAQSNLDDTNSDITTVTVNQDIETTKKLLEYFDLDTDYTELKIPEDDNFGLAAKNYGEGIRILRQDPWEATISFIISQRNNIPKIKSTIEKLSKQFGTKIKTNNKLVNEVYSFPTAKQLYEAGIDGLNSCGLGYRSDYVFGISKQYCNDDGTLFKSDFKSSNSEELYNKLLNIRGVGPKVANCISLFGYHNLDRFPIDVWIQRVIDEHYNGNIDISKYGNLAGLMQQYMFYYMTNS